MTAGVTGVTMTMKTGKEIELETLAETGVGLIIQSTTKVIGAIDPRDQGRSIYILQIFFVIFHDLY